MSNNFRENTARAINELIEVKCLLERSMYIPKEIEDGLCTSVREAIRGLKLEEKVGFPLGYLGGYYKNLLDEERIHVWGERSEISWSDDGRQPEVGTTLYYISYPCGAYTFAYGTGHYPVNAFKSLFDELKGFSPDFMDTTNKTLYWIVDGSDKIKNVHEALPSLRKKCQELVSQELKEIKRQELLKQLESLGGV